MLRLLLLSFALLAMKTAPILAQDDPHQWLEGVTDPKALDWVQQQNKRSLAVLEQQPRFADFRKRAEDIYADKRRIAYPDIQGDDVFNFWQDDANPRGLWRIATLKSYLTGKPAWRTLLDLDDLAKRENENWVWKGADCLGPVFNRCLVYLSRGGKDATILREFDRSTNWFAADGFMLGEAKHRIAWLDDNRLLVATDYGPGSLTSSGYPRIVKIWQRGAPITQARTIFEGKESDVWVAPQTYVTKEGVFATIHQGKTFWTGTVYHLRDDGQTVASPLPEDADFKTVFGGTAIAQLRSDLKIGDATVPRGSLVGYAIRPVLAFGGADASSPIEALYTPEDRTAVADVLPARDVLYVSILDKVKHRLITIQPGAPAWLKRPVSLPADGTLSLISAGEKSNLALIDHQNFTSNNTLYAVGQGGTRAVARAPARFDPARFTTVQHFATSKDGTQVPYFVVRPKGSKGPVPTYMFAYGGFEISLLPTYVKPIEQFWLEDGGAYVVANIRGGGEFGPDWHQAALKENRQRAYDDFHAVAEDLVKRGVTTPKLLGIHGRSNGGLLMGVALTQRPELYGGIIVGVPLADMKRYNKLLAGASWMGEYGDPDDPTQWAYISRYSPYQNLRRDAAYPRVFFYTSTKDDRVHPGHARKMAARMQEYGKDFFYYENIDGGHAGVANYKESANLAALMSVYLRLQLGAR